MIGRRPYYKKFSLLKDDYKSKDLGLAHPLAFCHYSGLQPSLDMNTQKSFVTGSVTNWTVEGRG